MSVGALSWAWGLAERLGVDVYPKGPSNVDERCWPSKRTLGARCRYGSKALGGHLAWLERHGLIERTQGWLVVEDGRHALRKVQAPDVMTLLVGAESSSGGDAR